MDVLTQRTCPHCQGTGGYADPGDCRRCNGAGVVGNRPSLIRDYPHGDPELEIDCPTCSARAGEDCSRFGYCPARSASIPLIPEHVQEYEPNEPAPVLCPGGCGCRLGTDDADRFECGCEEGCCG